MTAGNFLLAGLSLIMLGSLSSRAQILIGSTQVDTATVAGNLHVPWEILWGPDNRIWFTERNGHIGRVDPANGVVERLVTIPDVYEFSESGLLGMALHPDFSNSPYVYVVYNYLAGSNIQEKLVRYTYSSDTLTNPLILIDSITGNGNHNGSRIISTPDGKLMLSTGDAQSPSVSQQQGSLSGKILRINPDGSAPADNPVPGDPVWTKGHRNPQGLVFGPGGKLYSSEHGPNNDDELNIIEKGRNYGWPNVAGFCNSPAEITFCADSNVMEPLKAWTPTLAVAGIDYYPHADIPEFTNALLLTNLKESDLRSLKLNSAGDQIQSETIWLNGMLGRLRDLCISPDGKVYIATSNRDGRGTPAATDDRIIEIAARPLSVSRNEDNPVSFHPNPFSGSAVLKMQNTVSCQLSIYDITGREADAIIRQDPDRFTIHRGSLPAGLYLYQLKKGTGELIRGKLRIE